MSWINDLADALGFGNNKQTDDAQQTLDEMLARANSVSAQNRGLIRDYYDQMNGTFSKVLPSTTRRSHHSRMPSRTRATTTRR